MVIIGKQKISYADSGVDISAGEETVERIKDKVKSTFSRHVLTGIGGFGGAYDIKKALINYKHPVLIQSIDGVGTKIIIARMTGEYGTIGRDLVGNVVGDILAMGAKPLTFLDYVANEKLQPEIVENIVSGIADACAESGISLIGGETAEMPGIYMKNEIDAAGCVTGAVEKDNIITGKKITADDIILGLASSGLHTNGFSLARKVFFEMGKYGVENTIPEFRKSIGETLLEPHINYTKPILGILNSGIKIKGMAHITGGGITQNIPRILSPGFCAEIKENSWPILPVFEVIRQIGNLEKQEMYKTFNMGIGMVLIAAAEEAQKIIDKIKEYDKYKIYEIGRIIKSRKNIILKK